MRRIDTNVWRGSAIPYWVAALISVVLLIFFFQTLRKAYRPYGYDFTSYLLSARALLNNRNPYEVSTPFPYVYPLFLAFILVPMALMPYWLANTLWFILNVACLLFSCWVIVRKAGASIGTRMGWHLAIPGLSIFILVLSPIQNNLLNGQVNLVVLGCCAMFLQYMTSQKIFRGAAWLGAAIAFKLMPVTLLFFLVLRRRLGPALLSAAFALIFCFLPAIYAGRSLLTYYGNYVDLFLLPSLTETKSGSASGFNLQGLLAQFSPNNAQHAWIKILGWVICASLVLLLDIATIRSRDRNHPVWGFSGYLIAGVMVSPIGETHHLVMAIPGILLVMLKAMFDKQWRSRVCIRILLGCFIGTFAILPKVLCMRSLHFVSLTILLILLLLAVRRR